MSTLKKPRKRYGLTLLRPGGGAWGTDQYSAVRHIHRGVTRWSVDHTNATDSGLPLLVVFQLADAAAYIKGLADVSAELRVEAEAEKYLVYCRNQLRVEAEAEKYLVYCRNLYSYMGWALDTQGLRPCHRRQEFSAAEAERLAEELRARGHVVTVDAIEPELMPVLQDGDYW